MCLSACLPSKFVSGMGRRLELSDEHCLPSVALRMGKGGSAGAKTKKATHCVAFCLSQLLVVLFRYYVCRAGAFFALANLVLNYLTFAQA